MRRRSVPLRLLVAAAVALPFLGPAAADDRDHLEPRPPWVFFPEPDERTAAEIETTVANSFADLNKVVAARDLIVRRFGLVAVPHLAAEMRRDRNVPVVWNASLTAYALRDRAGPARELWPLVDPLVARLRDGAEPYKRAFAALALGAFRGPETVPPERGPDSVLEVRDRGRMAREALREAMRGLLLALDDPHPDVRVAAALALAKRGPDPDGVVRSAVLGERLGQDVVGVPTRQAGLVALGLLPGPGDEDRFLAALRHEEARVRAAAALGIGLQALGDRPPGWLPAPERLLRALKSDPIRPALDDGTEAVFSRGVLASRAGADAEWPLLFDVAIDPSAKKEAALAAVQALLFCPAPWLADRAIGQLKGGAVLPSTVVAGFLLVAARSGRAEGVAVARDYLGNGARRPPARAEWDVRYLAAIGLLRALAAGALADPGARRDAVAALEAGVKRGLEAGPIRDRIAAVLERRRDVLSDPAVPLPESDVAWVEAGFLEPYGLLSHSLEDAAVVRLNDLVQVMFSLHSRKGTPGEPDRTEVPQRFLKACLDAYPYFRRVDLLSSRGLRPPDAFRGAADPALEVRSPP